MKPFFVYLIRCADGSYYCGQTDDLDQRVQQHHTGTVGYTSTRKPLELVWHGEFETREGAIAFEQQIKGWSRAKKEALVKGDWGLVQLLARSRSQVPAVVSTGLRQAQPERVGLEPDRVGHGPDRVGHGPERVGHGPERETRL